MNKGLIIIGYYGIKEFFMKNNKYIDLAFNEDYDSCKWYSSYCDTATMLANEGNIVLLYNSKIIRKYLAKKKKDIRIAICCPNYSIKNEWIRRLKNIYNSESEKDEYIIDDLEKYFDSDIIDLTSNNDFDKIIINNISCDFDNIIKNYLNDKQYKFCNTVFNKDYIIEYDKDGYIRNNTFIKKILKKFKEIICDNR